MKKIFFSILCLLCLAPVAKADDYALDVKDFSQLKVTDGINVIYRCNPDSAGMVTFSCAPSEVSQLMFQNTKNTLKIELADDGHLLPRVPVVTVYSSFLQKVENSGDSTVYVFSPAPAAQFTARIVGNGTIIATGLHDTKVEGKIDTGKGHLVLRGKAQEVVLSNTGTGRIEAGGLEATTGKCKLLGTGPIDCHITNEVTIMGLGSGTVYLKGKPTIKNRTLGVKVELVD